MEKLLATAWEAVSTLKVILEVAIGLGLVIFIHELGHFLVAKWAGVKVERFSIGFPVPNVGPRAVILGMLIGAFLGLRRALENEPQALVGWLVGGTGLGALLWLLGRWGSFKLYRDRDETEYVLGLMPLGGYVKMLGQDDVDAAKLADEQYRQDPRSYPAQPVWKRMAIISAGVAMNLILAFVVFVLAFRVGVEYSPCVAGGVVPGSPAWEAGLEPGDEIVEINGRSQPKFSELQKAVALTHPGQAVDLKIQRSEQPPFAISLTPRRAEEELWPTIGVESTASTQLDVTDPVGEGFPAARATPEFRGGDRIVAVNGQKIDSFAQLQLVMARHAAESVTVTVGRAGADQQTNLVEIEVGPTHYQTLGLHMKMGPIVAVQAGSPAHRVLQEGDVITHFVDQELGPEFDPLHLPDALYQRAGQPVKLSVLRGDTSLELEITPQERPGSWGVPKNPDDPIAAPALGVAYRVLPEVTYVMPGSPAAEAGIQVNDRLSRLEIWAPKEEGDPLRPILTRPLDLEGKDKYAWPFVAAFLLQQQPTAAVEISFAGGETVRLRTVPDPQRFLPVRGMRMSPLTKELRTHSVLAAARLGIRETTDKVVEVYLLVRGIVAGQVSPKMLGGPITIAGMAGKQAQRGFGELLTLLGIISATLAVVNFLPIPVLDGGHMVFLIWELVRGKPPSEKVLVIANYVGLLLIVALMLWVLYLDVFVHRWFG